MARKKKKVKWKRTRDGIVFVEKQSMSQRMANLGFMQVSMGTFISSMILLLISLAAAIAMKGNAPLLISVPWVAAFGLSAIGFWATWYGHFHVGAESRMPWKYGIILNGGVLVFLIIVYIVGIIFG